MFNFACRLFNKSNIFLNQSIFVYLIYRINMPTLTLLSYLLLGVESDISLNINTIVNGKYVPMLNYYIFLHYCSKY